MSNSKGNQYPLWYISNEYQVFAVDSNNQVHQMSDVDFATDISISEDGIVWILSTTPDPDGGGARLFWSNGDSNWNEIATSDPGGVTITGAANTRCMYMTGTGEVYTLNTDGKAVQSYPDLEFFEISYGGNYFWAIMPEKPGGIPVLRFTQVADSTKTWTTFGDGVMPFGISTGYQGNCYGIDNNYNPVYFSNDGSSTGSSGAGVDGQALSQSFKNWNYLLSTDANENGNLIYKWVDTAGGTYEATTFRGIRVASSYYS